MFALYTDKKNCCGCAACMNICPTQAITMKPDMDGFVYPVINNKTCTKCGLCQKRCAFQNIEINKDEPLATFAAINRDRSVLESSASGGIFAALAAIVFEHQGVVFGCALNSEMGAEHICVDNFGDMKKLQGSKYVQSDIGVTYAEAKKYLEQGRVVLYTGTPCQIAGLKSYLAKDYENLITADLICHGVPSITYFKEYINWLQRKLKSKVIHFNFRDKAKSGWGKTGSITYLKNKRKVNAKINSQIDCYYCYFLKGYISRESCYVCKYAGGSRPGDFTMGDYWGIEKVHPEVDSKNGVSVLLVNSEKGLRLVDIIENRLQLTGSTFENAKTNNPNLRHPIAMSEKREMILKTFREQGYQAVYAQYSGFLGVKLMWYKLKAMIPRRFKKILKGILILGFRRNSL